MYGPVRFVHFPADQMSGSHRPSTEFRSQRLEEFCEEKSDDPQERVFRIRSGIPFDDWFRDNQLHHPLTNTVDVWQARGSALIALTKGLAFSLVEVVQCLFFGIFDQIKVLPHRKELETQWDGVCLSALAVISPNWAKGEFLAYWARLERCAAPEDVFYCESDS